MELKLIITRFVESFEPALNFYIKTKQQKTNSLKGKPLSYAERQHKETKVTDDGNVTLITCDRFAMKTFTYSPIANEIALSGNLKFSYEAAEVALTEIPCSRDQHDGT